MDISTVGNTVNAGNAVTDMAGALGKEDFLNLLLKQLSYQDPLNPMDSTEFTAQLSQFSSLEELSNINTTLEDVLAYQQSMQNASVANLIGKTVSVDGNTAYLADNAAMNYELSGDAASVEIKIYDASGKLVCTREAGAQVEGGHTFLWDGKDADGNPLPQGSYTFDVEAMSSTGDPVSTVSISTGMVTDIMFENGLTYVVMDNGTRVNLSDIKSIG